MINKLAKVTKKETFVLRVDYDIPTNSTRLMALVSKLIRSQEKLSNYEKVHLFELGKEAGKRELAAESE